MVGESLTGIRARIESLATDDGEFCVVCGRTGVRPVPVATARFPDRDTAESAAQTATAYRAVLRRWDPRAPWYDFIACEVPAGVDPPAASGFDNPDRASATLRGFCHDVAAAVFEALSADGFQDVESAIMDTYCESADQIDDPDELCVHLLGTLAAEIDRHLDQAAQAAVLRSAATELPEGPGSDRPLAGTFERLETVDLIGGYAIESAGSQVVGRQSWRVEIEEYALSSTTAALPTLPIALDLLRQLPRATVTLSDVQQVEETSWRFAVTAAEQGTSAGLARAQRATV